MNKILFAVVILTFASIQGGCVTAVLHPIEKTEEWQKWEQLEKLHQQLEKETKSNGS